MKKILLIGSGAREHIIAEALKNSRQQISLLVYADTKNPGIFGLASDYVIGRLSDFDSLGKFVAKKQPDFAVIGPEAPLANGVADFLLSYGVKTVGPAQTLARLESSKSFTRDLLEKYKIPGNPRFKVFKESAGIADFINELDGQFVVKYDGLKGGKGVKVSGEHLANSEEGLNYAIECLKEAGRVVIEEKLIGQEFSLMAFSDGQTTISMPAVQDHKRAYENDTGPNTGGMGSYSDFNHLLPFLKQEDVEAAHEITCQVVKALNEETGILYKGIAYGGFILTKNGVRVIEYNARFGDPEAMNVLSILKNDFGEICEAIINGRLHELKIEFDKKATVCKYAVPNGYPDNPVKNEKIIIEKIPDGVKLYLASIDDREGNLYLGGSRAVAVIGVAETIEEAEVKAESAFAYIHGPMFHRKDIGTKELIQKKVRMMEEIATWSELRGSAKDTFKKLGGGKNFIDNEREKW